MDQFPVFGVVAAPVFQTVAIEISGCSGLPVHFQRAFGDGSAVFRQSNLEQRAGVAFGASLGGGEENRRFKAHAFRPGLPGRVVFHPFDRPRIGNIQRHFVGGEIVARRRGQQTRPGVNGGFLPQVVTFGKRQLVGSENFVGLVGAPLRGFRTRNRANDAVHNACRTHKRRGMPAGQLLNSSLHHRSPNGRRACQAAGMLHRGIVGVAYPSANHNIRSVANRPVIAKIIGCPCFGGSREGQVER